MTANSTLSKSEEKQLIASVRTGDQAALRQLVDLHKDRLHSFIWRMTRHEQDAEDICQDAFLRAFASLDTFSDEYRFSTWLFTIGYRLCLNSLRRKHAITGDVDIESLTVATSETPATMLESKEAAELRETVWGAVDQLTPVQRATVLLFYRHELSCQDISRILDVPTPTVKSHLHRARGRLETMLESLREEDLHKHRNLSVRAG